MAPRRIVRNQETQVVPLEDELEQTDQEGDTEASQWIGRTQELSQATAPPKHEREQSPPQGHEDEGGIVASDQTTLPPLWGDDHPILKDDEKKHTFERYFSAHDSLV